ncbi:MAG: FecR family protein [Bacteroidales bacterium]|nr:FecR family protein [Bacteroidales bacterium]
MKENNEHIDELLIAYLLEEANNEQIMTVENWLSSSDENLKYFDELKKVWFDTLDIETKPVAVDVDFAWEKVEKRLNNEKSVTKTLFYYAFRIAAILIIFFGIFGIYKISTKTPNTLIIAATDSVLTETLSDGSIITLNENSSINFPDKFDKKQRLIKLEGEAFFEVASNPEQPFIIDAGGGYIQVVGTKFNVNTNKDSLYIDVYVEEGIVKIFSLKPDSIDTLYVILKAGDKGRINTKTGKPEKLEVIEENYNDLFWRTSTLKFNSCYIEDVAKTLEEIYNVKFEISDNAKNFKLTATFEDAELEQILDIISLTFDLEIKQNDKKYTINVSNN